MTAVDWDEVKRLAADFQKAQLSSTLQKLSERNCVEIITKLTSTKLLDVIFTVDGKEYVTPDHLGREIKDELYVHGGRINLVELAKILNVDLSQINKVASDVERRDKGIKLVLGQLIDKSYVLKIVGEINDKLCQNGHINVAELTLQYDLPADFLQSTIEKELGKTVHGRQDKQDPRIFYTEGFIARNRAKVRGALSAITKPTPIIAILGQCKVPERIFFSILENLQEMMQVPGVVTGKQGQNSIYVPTIYSKSQSEWVDNFYKQNGYLEYDALSRLGIVDPQGFVKRHFVNEKLTLLDSVAVGTAIIDQVDANVEEIIATSTFADIYPLLPSVFTPEDTETLLREALKRSNVNFHIFANTIIVSEAYLQKLSKSFEIMAEKRAKDSVESGKWLQSIAENKLKSAKGAISVDGKIDKKEERRKKASSGKAGGGSQGRETKTRSTKKKYNQTKNHDNESDDDNSTKNTSKSELVLITIDDVRSKLSKDETITDIDDFVEQLSDYLQPKLNKLALSCAEQFAQTTKNNNLSEIEERLNMLTTNIRIYDKGIKLLDKNSHAPLTKYLIKTLAVDFVNDIFKLAAQQNVIQTPNNLTTEARAKMLNDFPNDVREALGNLQKIVTTGNSIDDFLNFIEPAMASCCLVLRKFDKKKERPVVLGHRQAILEQLRETLDPALALHLVTSVLFTAATQCALHMSGRHVSTVLTFLQSHLDPTTVNCLSQYHDRVLEFLSSTDNDAKEEARKILEDDLDKIKEIANNFKSHLKSEKIHE